MAILRLMERGRMGIVKESTGSAGNEPVAYHLGPKGPGAGRRGASRGYRRAPFAASPSWDNSWARLAVLAGSHLPLLALLGHTVRKRGVLGGPSGGAVLSVMAAGAATSALTLGVVRRLERETLTDPLTGLYNRRGCERRLAEDLARLDRRAKGGGTDVAASEGLTLVAVDLDGLKRVNDGYGHAAGDAYLIALATLLEDNLRARDWVGRWAGDEFVVALWGDGTGHGARAVLERVVRDLLPRARVRLPDGRDVRVSASFGVAVAGEDEAGVVPHGTRDRRARDATGLLERADGALREAKRRGEGAIVYARDEAAFESPTSPGRRSVADPAEAGIGGTGAKSLEGQGGE